MNSVLFGIDDALSKDRVNKYIRQQCMKSCLEAIRSASLANVFEYENARQSGDANISPRQLELFDTTSSLKKRKLSTQDQAEESAVNSNSSAALAHSSTDSVSSSSLHGKLSKARDVDLSLSPSPPRFLPPHLHSEVLESSSSSPQPFFESSSTAGSSPSAAYAGLTLESHRRGEMQEREGHENTGNKRTCDDSLNYTELDTQTPSSLELQRSKINISHRSASPALKRPRSEAGDDASMEQGEGMEIDSGSSSNVTKSESSKSSESSTSELHSADEFTRAHHSATANTLVENDASITEESSQGTVIPMGQSRDIESGGVMPHAANLPSLDQQVEEILALASDPPEDGQRVYLVSTKWLNRAIVRSSHASRVGKIPKEATEGDIGPVDSTDIVMENDPLTNGLTYEDGEPFVSLKDGLTEKEDYQFIPDKAWNLLIAWYGLKPNSPVIVRFARSPPDRRDGFTSPVIELNPPVFIIRKVKNDTALTAPAIRERDLAAIRVLSSIHEPFVSFLRRAKTLAGIDDQTCVRVWFVDEGQKESVSGIATPVASRSASPAPRAQLSNDAAKKLVFDMNDFLSLASPLQRELLDAKDPIESSSTPSSDGNDSSVSTNGLTKTGTYVFEEQVGGPGGGEWPIDIASRNLESNGLGTRQNNSKLGIPKTNQGKSVMGLSGVIMTRGRDRKGGRVIGKVGLVNLGNSCYMNSALQCVRAVEELTRYFLADRYREDLNFDNPLNFGGDIANGYAHVIHNMFKPDFAGPFSPRGFKNTIGRHNSSFMGFGQQDSQEFVGFLLDGLNEDLSRIKKKPAVTKPDSTEEHVRNPVALKALAEEVWNGHVSRNDSVVTDLFAGLYQSTLVCPVCDKISITFDPFTTLTLQLPVENIWPKEVSFWPLRGPPIQMNTETDKNGSIRNLKDFVSERVGVKSELMQVSEVFKNTFYKHYADSEGVSDEMLNTDEIILYELESLPTNLLTHKSMTRYRLDSTLSDNIMIPVTMYRGFNNSNGRDPFGLPFFIVLNSSEAKDYDCILRKILEKVATLTTRDIFTNLRLDNQSEASEYHDMESTMDSDVSPESKIKTASLDSDDGFVNVSADSDDQQLTDSTHTISLFSGSEHDIRDPNTILPDELRTLFDIKVWRHDTSLIPNSYTITNAGNLQPLASRIEPDPKDRLTPNDTTSEEAESDSETLEEESYDNTQSANEYAKALLENQPDDSDEETAQPIRDMLSKQTRSKPKSNKMDFMNAKKTVNNSIATRQQAPLVRLSEGLVLDWSAASYDALFGGDMDFDDDRGSKVWDNLETFPDKELSKRKLRRQAREKSGASLDDCLDEFEKREVLSENDMWYCNRCKEHRRATKKFDLWKSPDILIIHLKRFSAGNGGFRNKIDMFIDYPTSGLDLTSRVSDKKDGEQFVYDLFAVDNHYGGLGGGHYTAYAKNFINEHWYDYNDTSVTLQSPDQVVTSAGYLLFYRRRSNKALGGRLFEEIAEEDHQAQQAAENEDDDQATSRNASPSAAGEGQRLDGYSLNGSSSASHEVGAAPREVDGSAGGRAAKMSNEGELPEYSENLAPLDAADESDSAMQDESFGVEPDGQLPGFNQYEDPGWNWSNIERKRAGSPNENDSERVSSNLSDPSERMKDFDGDNLDSLDFSDTTRPQDIVIPDAEEVEPLSIPVPIRSIETGTDDEDAVAEIHVENDDVLH